MLAGVRTTASFRLFGDERLTAHAVTSRLGIAPSRAFEAEDQLSPRSSGVRSASLWLLSSGEIEAGVELNDQIRRLLAVLEPVKAELWDLTAQGYRANWFCYVASSPAEHAAELGRGLLTDLLALPGDLWLDICGEPQDGRTP